MKLPRHGRYLVLCTCLVLTLSACVSQPGEDGPIDDRAQVPPVPEGQREFRTGEASIPPGTELQTCYFLAPEPHDLYATALTTYQGRFGHHVILFRSVEQEEPGTVRDCTEASDMANLIPVIAPITFDMDRFPPGMALHIPAGTQLVIQQHYLNTTERELVTSDAMHLAHTSRDEVEVLAGFFGLSYTDFSLMPGSSNTLQFDCAVPKDISFLNMGPHMHEYGTKFQTLAGKPDNLETLIDVDPWLPAFRDDPPMLQWTVDNALHLDAGDILRTICELDNVSDHELRFPEEMCVTFGYYYPAEEGAETWICEGSEGM